jgi:CHAT domain-containing protein
VRLAVMGACEGGRRDQVSPWSGIASALTTVGVPAVLGMQYAIVDANAGAFTRRFYRALTLGQPVDAAVTDGRLAIRNPT